MSWPCRMPPAFDADGKRTPEYVAALAVIRCADLSEAVRDFMGADPWDCGETWEYGGTDAGSSDGEYRETLRVEAEEFIQEVRREYGLTFGEDLHRGSEASRLTVADAPLDYLKTVIALRERGEAGLPAEPLESKLLASGGQITDEELFQPPPQQAFILDSFIPDVPGATGVLAGWTSTGKTAEAIGLMVDRALGRPHHERMTKPGASLFVTAEEQRSRILRQFYVERQVRPDVTDGAWRTARNLMGFVHAKGMPRLVRTEGRLFAPDIEVIRALASVKRKQQPDADLLVLETASRLGVGEGNPEHAALVQATDILAEETGATVLLLAHVSQNAHSAGDHSDVGVRGGTALVSDTRFTVRLVGYEKLPAGERMKDLPKALYPKLIGMWSAKLNDGAAGTVVTLFKKGLAGYGAALQLFDPRLPEHARVIEEGRRRQQQEAAVARVGLGERIAAFLAEKGEPLSARDILRARKDVSPDISEGAMREAIREARESGWLADSEKKKGGAPLLVPGPKFIEEQQVEEEGQPELKLA